ncbi:hypothetical protein Q5P01_022047 [Channa striata]|uniref:Major facilitator superfamily (MFS) profile domain-containing protein n=1 Tax=Channa striata TaxID=64152 RepID=A0AA88LMA0_CHASR|nr:hypothetical protein Q5P01_022047 [Channa striata]
MADFGEILSTIGEFGLFQQVTLFALCFPSIVQAFVFASFIFIQTDPERHCNTDWILRTGPNLTVDEQLNLTLPREEDGSFSRCRMFVPVDWDIGAIREYGLNETTVCQSGWIYSNTLYEATIVTDSDPERHCNTDWILRTGPNLTIDEQLNLTLPREEDGSFSRCRMFVPVDWDIGAIREYGLNETTVCQSGWIYSNTLYEATIVTDFDLVCDKAKLLEVTQTVFMAGTLIGSLILGPFAESFGRKRATQIPAVIMFIFTLTTGLLPNGYSFLASQFMVGFGAGAYRVNSIILSTEWIGASKRSWGACVTQLFGAVGQCVLAGMIYAIRDWRVAQLITAAPLTLVVIYIWFIPESARWLLSRGRTEEAKQLIVKAAAINKRTVPDSLLDKIALTDVRNKGGIKVIFKSPTLSKYFFIITLAWFSVNLSIFSLYFNTENLGLNVFMTQLLFGAIEIPALIICIWLLEVLGRKILLISTLVAGGLSSVLILAVPEGYDIAVTFLAVTARFFLIGAGSICNVFIQELFPTSVRQTATALGTILARIGALMAPMLNILAMYHWIIPITVFSVLTLISGALCFLLSETRSKELPDSTDEAENNRNGTVINTTSCPDPNSTKL